MTRRIEEVGHYLHYIVSGHWPFTNASDASREDIAEQFRKFMVSFEEHGVENTGLLPKELRHVRNIKR